MSINKYQEHVLLLPEDDAIRQIANGFLLDPTIRTNKVQVLPVAGGWNEVVNDVLNLHGNALIQFPKRFLVGLMDFDNQQDRLHAIRERLLPEYADRVFVLGIGSEAEDLRKTFGLTFESIGKSLATDCRRGTNEVWGHELLASNVNEIDRLRKLVFPFLFDSGER